MDDINWFEKNLKSMGDSNTSNKPRYQMEFNMGKYTIRPRISRKRQITNGTEVTNQEIIWTIGKKKRKFHVLVDTGNGHHQATWDERKTRKDYRKRTRKLLENKLYRRNLNKGIHAWPDCLEDIQDHFWNGRTQTNGQEYKKVLMTQ